MLIKPTFPLPGRTLNHRKISLSLNRHARSASRMAPVTSSIMNTLWPEESTRIEMKASARVLLGAATTVLGVIPLVFDAFWI